jgi:hypothetical protein
MPASRPEDEQPLVLLGYLGGELVRGLLTHDLFDGCVVLVRLLGIDPWFARNCATALAFAVFVAEQVKDLAGGDHVVLVGLAAVCRAAGPRAPLRLEWSAVDPDRSGRQPIFVWGGHP